MRAENEIDYADIQDLIQKGILERSAAGGRSTSYNLIFFLENMAWRMLLMGQPSIKFKQTHNMKNKFDLHHLIVCGLFLLCLNLLLVPANAQAANGSGIVDQTKTAVANTGTAVADDAKSFWANHLKNRSPDEIAAWVVLGVLVGALAGMFTSLQPSFLGNMGKLLLGLAGAFLGAMVVSAAKINFGWGGIAISYEEALFSLLGAVVLVVMARLVRSRATSSRSSGKK